MKTKAELIERWEKIIQRTIGIIPDLCELYNDQQRNYKGDFNSGLHGNYRRLAVLGYLLNNNVLGFKENLSKAVPIKMELMQRYNKGDPIHPSRVSMTRFEELFDALASGDMSLAQTYASYIGGRPEIEEEYDNEFTLLLGYSLKYAVENNLEELQSWLLRLKAFCEDLKHKKCELMGYPLVLESLLERDVQKANEAFKVLIEEHKNKCKSKKTPAYGPDFSERPDADLFVWGIGLVNLCRYYGMDVQVSDLLIPEELLISVKNM